MTRVRQELLAVAAEIGHPLGLELREERDFLGQASRLHLAGQHEGWPVGVRLTHLDRANSPDSDVLEAWVGVPDHTVRETFHVAPEDGVVSLLDRLLGRDIRVFVPGFDERHLVTSPAPGYVRALLQDPRVRECVVEVGYWGAELRGWPRGGIHARLERWDTLRGRGLPIVQSLLRLAPLLVELKDIAPLEIHEVVDTQATGARSGSSVVIPDVMRAEVGLEVKKRRRRG